MKHVKRTKRNLYARMMRNRTHVHGLVSAEQWRKLYREANRYITKKAAIEFIKSLRI